jgi:hypothetical protein
LCVRNALQPDTQEFSQHVRRVAQLGVRRPFDVFLESWVEPAFLLHVVNR